MSRSNKAIAKLMQMGWSRRRRWLNYAFAAAVTFGMLLAWKAIWSDVGDDSAIILFLVPITLSAYLGGLGPGLASTVLAALFADYYLLPPVYSFSIASATDAVEWVSLIAEGAFISLLTEALHRSRRRAEASRTEYAVTLASIGDAVIAADVNGNVAFLNAEAERLTGWTNGEAASHPLTSVFKIIDEQTRESIKSPVKKILHSGNAEGLENRIVLISKDGSETSIEDNAAPIKLADGTVHGTVLVFRDCTEKRRAESIRKQAEKELRESEERLLLFVEHAPASLAMFDLEMRYLTASRRWLSDFNFEGRDLRGLSHYEVFPEISERWKAVHRRALAGEVMREDEDRFDRADGSVQWLRWEVRPWRDAAGDVGGIVIFCEDITERKRTEEELRSQEMLLRDMGQIAKVGGWGFDPVTGAGNWTEEVARIHDLEPGIKPSKEMGLNFYYGESRARIEAAVKEAVEHGTPYDLELEIVSAVGIRKWIRTICLPLVENGKVLKVRGSFQDITERKQAEEELLKRTEDLMRSNADLEQFAYVASHDLQEPLRAVAGCVQLLQRRYQGKIDARADEFIEHAVEGVLRMQKLIGDLLDFSRIGTRGGQFQRVNSEAALKAALRNLTAAIRESEAAIAHDPLPKVNADPSQLISLFQNLIGNAIKFRGDAPPQIYVAAKRDGKQWEFSVRDNGIGFEQEYSERIFGVFQRLHTRTEYAGTGIGLAVCKKIVERHGGKIWVESAPGMGSVFYFTLFDGE